MVKRATLLPAPVSVTDDHLNGRRWRRALKLVLLTVAAYGASSALSFPTTSFRGRGRPLVEFSQQQPQPRNPAYLIKAYNGAVASENKLCSELGVSVLKQGGNAVDAAVATTFCIGVVNMYSCVSPNLHVSI